MAYLTCLEVPGEQSDRVLRTAGQVVVGPIYVGARASPAPLQKLFVLLCCKAWNQHPERSARAFVLVAVVFPITVPASMAITARGRAGLQVLHCSQMGHLCAAHSLIQLGNPLGGATECTIPHSNGAFEGFRATQAWV